MNQRRAPFFEALRAYATEEIVPFHTPGHKQGRGAPSQWLEAVGKSALQLDVSDVVVSAQFNDSWHAALAAAEGLTADALDADFCFFLANGTTSGIHAMLLSAVSGRSVIIARNSHRSVVGGLILADALPIYVDSPYDAERHVWLPPPPSAWRAALADNPDAAAVLVTYPTYEGIACDLPAIVQAASEYGALVLVDEAHGAHFGLHPRLPERAIGLGADLSAQSPHKLLGSMTQASWLLGREENITSDRVATALGVLQSTSPSGLLLASLDIARRQIAVAGARLMEEALLAADAMRACVDKLKGVDNVDFSHLATCIGGTSRSLWDETKVLIDVSQLGMSGFEAARRLRQKGVQVEMGTARHVLALATFGDTDETIAAFCQGLTQLVEDAFRHKGADSLDGILSLPARPPQRMRPRQAALGPSRRIPLADAAGLVAADFVCPYPPGIPVLYPGEEVSAEAVEYLHDILKRGGEVRGLTGEPRRPSVRVVE